MTTNLVIKTNEYNHKYLNLIKAHLKRIGVEKEQHTIQLDKSIVIYDITQAQEDSIFKLLSVLDKRPDAATSVKGSLVRAPLITPFLPSKNR